MSLEVTASRWRRLRGELSALQVLVVVFLALRLYFDLNADLLGDESYYWMWGQHLGWSYFDHPPLHAWLLRAVSLLTGWDRLGVRLLTWVTLVGVFGIFWSWAKRLAPDDSQLWFWRAAAIYLASPLFFAMTTVAYNDHLLVVLSLLAVHCFVVFTDRHETGAPQALRWLYFAAMALGLAMLSKYNGIFVGLGFAATFVLRPKLRELLRTPHPWLAAALALVMQAPVIWWNLSEGLASYRYHLDDRWGSGAGHINVMHAVTFVLFSVVLWSPVLLWPLLRLIRSTPTLDFEARARTLTLATFAISTVCLLLISLPLGAYFYWNIVAFVGLMPLLVRFMDNAIVRWMHFVFGLACAAALVFTFTTLPLGIVLGGSDNGTAINYGWDEIAGHVRLAEASNPTDMIGATRYSTTSQLGFALGIADAVKLSPEHSQYDYWQANLPLAGKSAMILVDEADSSPVLDWLRTHFTTLSQVDSFDITRQGRRLYSWRLFRGDEFKP